MMDVDEANPIILFFLLLEEPYNSFCFAVLLQSFKEKIQHEHA
jgi:hypothetical protein